MTERQQVPVHQPITHAVAFDYGHVHVPTLRAYQQEKLTAVAVAVVKTNKMAGKTEIVKGPGMSVCHDRLADDLSPT